MRALLVDCTLALLALSLGCTAPPPEVAGDGTSTGLPSPTSTGPGPSTAEGSTGATTRAASSGGASASTSTGGVDPSDSGSGDASTGEPTDEPLGPFGAPVQLVELGSALAEDDPTLTADMLEIYFGSTRGGLEDVWMSTRGDVGDAWDAPVRVATLSSVLTDTLVEVSGDGLVVLLASDRAFAGDLDVYYSRRSDRAQPWPDPQPLAGAANPGSNDFGVTPTADPMRAFLCRAPLGQAEVYEAAVDLTTWVVTAPVVVAELSSPQDDCSVSVSTSGRELFLETTRPAAVTGWNLFVATREDPADPWSAPVEVAELNTLFDEQDPWLSPDRRTLYFASNRDGTLEIYVATRR